MMICPHCGQDTGQSPATYRAGAVTWHSASRTLAIGSVEVRPAPQQRFTLMLLMQPPGVWRSHAEIREAIGRTIHNNPGEAVRKLIYFLRKLLRGSGAEIENCMVRGYRIIETSGRGRDVASGRNQASSEVRQHLSAPHASANPLPGGTLGASA